MSTRSNVIATTLSAGIIAAGWMAAVRPVEAITSSAPTTTTSQTTTSQSSSTRTTTSSASASATPSTAQKTTITTAPTTQTTKSQTTTSAASNPGSYVDGTWTGSPVQFRYGTVTVTVTINDGQIASVTENLVSDGDHHSDSINQRAVPTLRQNIIAANSAKVSTIGGATYTTKAYLSSLQSALDQAK